MNVGQLIEELSRLDPDVEVGLSQWKLPNYTTWEFIPLGWTMVTEDSTPTIHPEETVKVVFHRR